MPSAVPTAMTATAMTAAAMNSDRFAGIREPPSIVAMRARYKWHLRPVYVSPDKSDRDDRCPGRRATAVGPSAPNGPNLYGNVTGSGEVRLVRERAVRKDPGDDSGDELRGYAVARQARGSADLPGVARLRRRRRGAALRARGQAARRQPVGRIGDGAPARGQARPRPLRAHDQTCRPDGVRRAAPRAGSRDRGPVRRAHVGGLAREALRRGVVRSA